MAKGRTNQPLVIWVAEEYADSPPVQSLRAQGHQVYGMDQPHGLDMDWWALSPDLILHPAAHQWNEFMWQYLPAAIAAARKRKRENKG